MARVDIVVGGALLFALVGAPVWATEVQVGTTHQRISDESFYLVSPYAALDMMTLHVTNSLGFANLSWTAGYEFGRTENTTWGYLLEADWSEQSTSSMLNGALDLHGLEAGLRWSAPFHRRVVPYVSVSAKGYAGYLRVEDQMTGWSYPGTVDEGAEPDYTAEKTRRWGFTGGGLAVVGIHWVIKRPGGGAAVGETAAPAAVPPEQTAAAPVSPEAASQPVAVASSGVLRGGSAETADSPAGAAPSIEGEVAGAAVETAGEEAPVEEGETGAVHGSAESEGGAAVQEEEEPGQGLSPRPAPPIVSPEAVQRAEAPGQASQSWIHPRGNDGGAAVQEEAPEQASQSWILPRGNDGRAAVQKEAPEQASQSWAFPHSSDGGAVARKKVREVERTRPDWWNRAMQGSWGLGLDTSAGYTLSAPLTFRDVGELSMSGIRFQVGLNLSF